MMRDRITNLTTVERMVGILKRVERRADMRRPAEEHKKVVEARKGKKWEKDDA